MRRPEKPVAAAAVDVAEVTVTAGEMAGAINTVAHKLLGESIITSEGFTVLTEEARRLKRSPDATDWEVEVDRDNAIVFAETLDETGTIVVPRISCKGISVQQIQHDRPPFSALDISLEIEDNLRNPLSRWHVDWANSTDGKFQPGPLSHLQYGGHRPGYRESDHPLKVPRWIHPPMDLLLLCEVVTANFYEDQWHDLREDQNWCSAIATGQRLCYSAYLRKMLAGLSVSSKTMLHSMWASHWGA